MMNINVIKKLLLILFPICLGCNGEKPKGEANTVAIEVIDAQGQRIALEQPAERIVCLYEPGLDALYMLHAERRIVGIFNDVYVSDELFPFFSKMDDRIKERKLPVLGTNNQGNVEHIVGLNPDLIIVHAGQTDLVEALRNAGMKVYATRAELKAEVFKTVEDIATLTANTERGMELISYVKQKEALIKKRSDGIAKKRRVYFTWAYGRVFSTTGTNSMMHACLEMAGVENVCPFELDQPNINAETLIAWNPDMIVMWNDSPQLFYRRNEFAEIPAIKDKQIFNLLPMFAYNPHTLKALCTATAIHHWAYEDKELNQKAQVKEIIAQLYGKQKADKIIDLL
ncbi:MAG: ABC transporter substrate-binding protein [Sphingobacterium sp.]|jgi:iron complex transport system substrate-binding protein|nr:ABC transporter substrate-binding protein [Sphingobacterium sp.]